MFKARTHPLRPSFPRPSAHHLPAHDAGPADIVSLCNLLRCQLPASPHSSPARPYCFPLPRSPFAEVRDERRVQGACPCLLRPAQHGEPPRDHRQRPQAAQVQEGRRHRRRAHGYARWRRGAACLPYRALASSRRPFAATRAFVPSHLCKQARSLTFPLRAFSPRQAPASPPRSYSTASTLCSRRSTSSSLCVDREEHNTLCIASQRLLSPVSA